MKKLFAVLFMTMFLLSGTMAMASPPVNPGPGFYEKQNGSNKSETKYFPNGQPENNSEWKFAGTNPPSPPSGGCNGSGCLQTASTNSGLYPNTAAPSLWNSSNNPWGNATGGWGAGGAGKIEVTAYAQGTKFAEVDAYATGTVYGNGFAGGIETPHFGMGASGAIATTTLFGIGSGYGLDKPSFTKNPDFASVLITYSGIAAQKNGINVQNGQGSFAGGFNSTQAEFGGGSYTSSDGKIGCLETLIFIPIPAFAINADGGMGYAAGFTTGGYVDVPNFAAAKSLTVGVSGYVADYGVVSGSGTAYHQAVAKGSENGSYGISAGQAEFCYNGTGNFGAGYATTGGYSVVTNGAHSSTVTSVSHAQAGSMVGGSPIVRTLN